MPQPRLAAELRPRRPGVRSDAAPERLTVACREEHVETTIGRQGDAELRSGEDVCRVAERLGAGAGADRVDHRRVRLDRQPQRRFGVAVDGGQSIERGTGVLDRDGHGVVAGGKGGAHVGQLGDAHQLVCLLLGRISVVVVDDLATDEERADHEHDCHGKSGEAPLQVISFVSATAWRSPSSSITRLSTSCS